ncbi:MAG: hypothetical protein FWC23_01115 [Chitinispirillia bacterium]|nr:hypothetical protein [Chitinispirillia bacterium]MCL2267776.1 hypothetical protein [Chitinispirillia bacterium]
MTQHIKKSLSKLYCAVFCILSLLLCVCVEVPDCVDGYPCGYEPTATTYTLTVNTSGTGSGTVSPASQSGITAGTVVDITASPASGYTFNRWMITSGSGTIVDPTSASTSVTVNGNATVTANFKLDRGNATISGNTLTDSDGKQYRIVTIGSQMWMAENLNYNASGSVCYNNQESNCNTYGRLYDWATVMNGASSSTLSPSGVQGICPSGWHVPSDAEWETLVKYVDPNASGDYDNNAGTKLKSTSGWSGGGNGTDEHGFSALPCGDGYSAGSFGDAGYYGRWWSATERGASYAWLRDMSYEYDFVYRYNRGKTTLHSVRCLKG